MNALDLHRFEQDSAAMADIVPSFLRRFLDRCEELKLPEGLADDAARMALECFLIRMDDGGSEDLEVEPDEPRPRIFRES